MEYLEKLTDAQYEQLAKKIADAIADHDTLSKEFTHQQHKHSGEIFYRMTMGSRKKAHNMLKGCTKPYRNNWHDLVQDECFADYVLAFLCGNGFEVEWPND